MDKSSRPPLMHTNKNVDLPVRCLTIAQPQAGPSHIQPFEQIKNFIQTKEDINKRSLYIKCRKIMKKICQLRNHIYKLKTK